MKTMVTLLALIIFAGCKTAYYSNEIPNATPLFKDVSISELPASNGVFRVFKVNDNIALLKWRSSTQPRGIRSRGRSLDDKILNSLIILDEKQLGKLKEFCSNVVNFDETKQSEDIKIFKYNLIDNKSSTKEHALAYAIGEYHHSYLAEPNLLKLTKYHSYLAFQYLSKKKNGRVKFYITYRWHNSEPVRIRRAAIASLLSDISQ